MQAATIILASSSPRRLELLSHLNVQFTVKVPDFEERQQEGEKPWDYVQRNAAGKAQAVASLYKKGSGEAPSLVPSLAAAKVPTIVLAADTIVVLGEDEVLEKPRDEAEAASMLTRLSGVTHTVFTGLCMISIDPSGAVPPSQRVAAYGSEVCFKNLTPDEIKRYIATGEPMDKAGSYAVQGKGSYLIASLRGSYTNVMGLPLTETYEWLEELAPGLFA